MTILKCITYRECKVNELVMKSYVINIKNTLSSSYSSSSSSSSSLCLLLPFYFPLSGTPKLRSPEYYKYTCAYKTILLTDHHLLQQLINHLVCGHPSPSSVNYDF